MLSTTLVKDRCTILSPTKQPNCPLNGYVVPLRGFMQMLDVVEDTDKWLDAMNELMRAFSRTDLGRTHLGGIHTRICAIPNVPTHVHFDLVGWAGSIGGATLMAATVGMGRIHGVEKGDEYRVDHNDEAPPA